MVCWAVLVKVVLPPAKLTGHTRIRQAHRSLGLGRETTDGEHVIALGEDGSGSDEVLMSVSSVGMQSSEGKVSGHFELDFNSKCRNSAHDEYDLRRVEVG